MGQPIPDPGTPTIIEFAPNDLKVGESRGITAFLENDEAIEAITMKFAVRGPNGLDPTDFVRFDSATFLQFGQLDPDMLNWRVEFYMGNVTGDGIDTAGCLMACSNPPHVPLPANLNPILVTFWFTGIAPGYITTDLPDPPSFVRVFPDGNNISSGVFFVPEVVFPAQYTILPETTDPQCGDRDEPDVVTLTDIHDAYPIGESTPLSVSLTIDEEIVNFSSTLRFYSADTGSLHYDSIHYVGRLADPNVAAMRIVANGWADGVLPDSINIAVFSITGVNIPVGSGPLFEVYLSGTALGQVQAITTAKARPVCPDGTTHYIIFSVDPEYLTVGDPVPPAPVFQPLANPDPVSAEETVMFTVEASSPDSNPIELNLLSLHPYDDDSGQPVSQPTFGGGVFAWTPGYSDIGIWTATFEAVDLVSYRSTTASTIIQVVSGTEYLIAYDVEEVVDAVPANSLVHGDFDKDGAPEIMVAGDAWVTGKSLAVYDRAGLGFQEVFALYEDYPNRGLALGYIDQDSYLDAVTCLYNEVWVLLGSSNNSFNVMDANVPRPGATFVDAILADYNGDAWLDYVCLSTPNVVTVYAGGPNASFSQAHSYYAGASVQSLAAADLDNDGWEDLTIGTNQGLEVYLNNGLGAYLLAYTYPQDMGAYDIDITDQGSDFDGDGIFDLCLAAHRTGENAGLSNLQVYYGQGDGSYDVTVAAVVQGVVIACRPGDFNGDGHLDIAFVNSTELYVAILFGDGAGAFENQLRYEIPKYRPRRLDCMDIDLDGDLDLVVSSWEFDALTLYSSLFVYVNNLNPGGMMSASMRITALDNVDVAVDGPNGKHLDNISSTMPSAALYRRDLNGNSSLDVDIKAPIVSAGCHALTVIPRPNQAPDQTFSLTYTAKGETLPIARNLPVPQQKYVFPIYPDGDSKVSPLQGQCVKSVHPIFKWETDGIPTIDFQSSLPFSDNRIEFRISTDPEFSDILESAMVTSGLYVLQTTLAVEDTVSYFWQIRHEDQTEWGGIYVFHALPVVERFKDPVDTDADNGFADEGGGGNTSGSEGAPGDGGDEADSNAQYGDNSEAAETGDLPHDFSLLQNQPNPFNPVTQISYSLAREGQVRLDIYNILGNRVVTLVDEYQGAGDHVVTWDAGAFASGIYLYRISMDGFSATKKMLLLK